MGRGRNRTRRELASTDSDLDSDRLLTAAWRLRDRYAADLPADYDLFLAFTATRFCLTVTGPNGFRQRECLDVAPDDARSMSVFRHLVSAAKLHDSLREPLPATPEHDGS
jgi:hypothetical protein